MLGRLKHRGPDDDGIFEDAENGVFLGHKRLAIIDLSLRAHQPMSIGPYVIVFNGEIYNYAELKKEYLQGYNFSSNSDTEVIVVLYALLGIEKTLSLIRGMFAFCIYDRLAKRIIIARDHIGKKPLYLADTKSGIYFSSEIKALMDAGIASMFDVDESVIDDCLYYRFSSELSPFKNVKMLSNGHYLIVRLSDRRLRIRKYFDFAYVVEPDKYQRAKTVKYSELVEELDGLLLSAVKSRLIADTEVASITSGGLDSSLVTAIACGFQKVRMLHIDVARFSETKYAQLLASKFGSGLLVKPLDVRDVEEKIDQTIYHYEYPLVHPNAIGIAMLSKLSRENGIKVLLGGDGADELFCGYPFQRYYYHGMLLKKHLMGAAPVLFKGNDRFYNKYLSGPDIVKSYVYETGCHESERLLERQRQAERVYGFLKNPLEQNFNAFQLAILNEYLQPLLLRADKMGMMNSVEIRSPFLDLDVITFALNLPARFKINLSGAKVILKDIAKRYVPHEIISRKKKGFFVPLPAVCRRVPGEHYGRSFVKYSAGILKTISHFNLEGERHLSNLASMELLRDSHRSITVKQILPKKRASIFS